ncbi:D-tyrosyl-tRNA(Tyr) deacylase [candidate division KSB1 bacterium]|nr:D-tyrosyl-tRNA(Tyr) deacylase [candidate division KSB1 bacterium]RQW08046.1 MAG: D-tyrosyl-tRNA(Tyr) deacylase [candidate division KSB1 bacterium]
MRALVQRVQKGSVAVGDEIVGRIGPGLVILLGVRNGDDETAAAYLANKIVNLRIFQDENEKFDRSALAVGAELLAISQFTLYADTTRGRRPGFSDAAPPPVSIPLYEKFVEFLRESNLTVQTGVFGAHMIVEIINDGPVTILLDSEEKRKT